jgi:hypothetical protein
MEAMVTIGQRDGIRSTAGQLGGILVRAVTVVRGLSELTIEQESFGAMGKQLATVDARQHARHVAALHDALNTLWQGTNSAQAPHGRSDGLSDKRFWSTPVATRLGRIAVGDGISPGHPASVGALLIQLVAVGLAHPDGLDDVPARVGDFADWLDASAEHQMAVGLVAVYAGPARDTPGVVRCGDVAVIEPVDGEPMLGVVGDGGSLHNDGPLAADFGAVATLRVYRPIVASGR